VLDRALLILEDWAQGATLTGGIDRERSIVLSEWRMNLGDGERTQDRSAACSSKDRYRIGRPSGSRR
jgi:predicted Zn-dependent peptidase